MSISYLRELFDYDLWANLRLMDVTANIDDAGLDRPFEMGCGTLRETVKHINGAERVWYERIGGDGWESLSPSSPLRAVVDVRSAAEALHTARDRWLGSKTDDDLSRAVSYKSMKGEPLASRLGDILVHVCHHGVHHRAQAANMCRHLGAPLKNGDYLHMRLERPTLRPPAPAAAEKLRASGLTIGEKVESPRAFSAAGLWDQFRYNDWANARIVDAAAALPNEALDRPFEIGPETLRKTLVHIEAADRFWADRCCDDAPSTWKELDAAIDVGGLREAFFALRQRREALLRTLDDDSLQREVWAEPGPGMRLDFRMGEALLQVCFHGAHHRAQALNMLRHLGGEVPALDFILWKREE